MTAFVSKVSPLDDDVTEPKFLCPMLQKAKTKDVRVWGKEKFID